MAGVTICSSDTLDSLNYLALQPTRPHSTHMLYIQTLQTHHECHVIAAEGDDKHYCSYVIKTVNPFPPLWSLTSHIEHAERHKTDILKGTLSSARLCVSTSSTFTYLTITSFILKWVSIIPFVRTLARSTSVGVGTYFSLQIRSIFSNKLLGGYKHFQSILRSKVTSNTKFYVSFSSTSDTNNSVIVITTSTHLSASIGSGDQ